MREVRTAEDLEGLDGLVMPGGESTTMTLGIEREGLADPLRDLVRSGTPVFGTCAGLIMLDRYHLGLLDVKAQRNAFGRQVHSFETDLDIEGDPVHAIFIRAPWIADAATTSRCSPRSTAIPWRCDRTTCSRSRSTPSWRVTGGCTRLPRADPLPVAAPTG